MKRLLLIFLLIFTAGAVCAQLAEIGFNPLRLESAARPLGLGGAFTGLADDASAVLYNPGGQAWVKGVALTLKDLGNNTGVMAFPTGNNSSLGLAIVNTNLSAVPVAGGTAASSSNVVLLAYGTKLNFLPYFSDKEIFQKLGFGFSVKGLLGETLRRSGQPDRSAVGWDMDLGVLYKGADWWSAGATLQNILPAGALGGGQVVWDVGGTEGVPAALKLGGSARIIGDLKSPVFVEGRELLIAGELDLSRSGALLRIGGEWGVDKTYYLRAGVMQQEKPGSTVTSLNLGLGYRSGEWGADIVRSREPLRDEDQTYFSILYFPKEWIVQTKLEADRPVVMLEAALEKISLADNIESYDDRIEVFGAIKSGVEVYVNDARAVTAGDNTFKVMVPLQLGKNLIVVEARYQGEKKDWTYKILRKAKVEVAEEKEVKRELARAKTSAEVEVLKKKEEQVSQQKQKVEELVTLGVVEVAPGAEFRLDASLTRGDLATWLAKASGFRLPRIERDLYADVKMNDPLAPYIKIVVDAGLLAPFPDGTFRPEAPVTKEEGDKLFRLLRKAAK
jgi:hypothetical protein